MFIDRKTVRNLSKKGSFFLLGILGFGLILTIVIVQQQQDTRTKAAGTTLSLTVFLHGVGKGGDSANPTSTGTTNPKRLQRTLTVELYNQQNQLVLTKQATVTFNSTNGNFTGSFDRGTTLPTGFYLVKIKADQYLRASVPGIQSIASGQDFVLPPTTLIAGDITNDNAISILDYNVLMDCYSDFSPAVNCTPTNKLLADLTDDGNVNQFDYNLFLRESSNRQGDQGGGTVAPTPTKATTPTPTRTPTPTATRTPTPQPVSGGFPGSTNTGYKNAPGYPGSLTTYSATANGKECSGPIASNKTYHYCNFPNGLEIGSTSSYVENVTFYGCRFASNAVDYADVVFNNGNNVTFDYSTFEPNAVSSPPVAYNKGYQFGITQRQDDRPTNTLHGNSFTVDHSDFWGFGNGMQLARSTQAQPVIIRNSWFHDTRDDGGIDHTDAILSNDGGSQMQYITVHHNTIVAKGNTNGLALQYAGSGYSNITVTNNYFSGFGYTVNMGGTGHLSNSTFTDNTFGTDIKPVFGPLYGWGGTNNVWRRNKWHVVPGSYYTNSADDGKYWWPNGTLSTTDYTGQ